MSFNPSGGALSGATDVALSNPANNQAFGFDSAVQKWRNKDGSAILAKETVNFVPTSGASVTLPDPAIATITSLTLTANCAVTMPATGQGLSFTLVVNQDATGGRTVTWPVSVKWPGGTAPTLTPGPGSIDYITFMCPNSAWHGFLSGSDIR